MKKISVILFSFVFLLTATSCEKEEHFSTFSDCNCAPGQMVYNRFIEIDMIDWPVELSDFGSEMVREKITSVKIREACRTTSNKYCIRKISSEKVEVN